MTVTDARLRAAYEAAVERLAGRVLGALDGTGGTFGFPQPPDRAELAAVRVLGPDLFAARLFGCPADDDGLAEVLAEAYRVFPPTAGGDDLTAWHDWATVRLARRVNLAVPVPAHDPSCAPTVGNWRLWSLRLTRLAPLALPGLEGPVHAAARAEPLALARGTVRAVLRRDHRTAARLTRWLAWLDGVGLPLPVEVGPLLIRLKQVGDGSARTALHLTVAERLLRREAR
ncbi:MULTISPECIES: hypothetical protein [Streptomyces]|uniref:Uncharacterized protein n=1 Tax=Streptomyces fimbriatus TaxID=68197 RepID=A0ABW0DFS7_STRFI